jgi:hypothetical protein
LISLVGNNDRFSDGHTTGYLEFYNERHRPSFPLTSHVVRDHLMAIFHEPDLPSLWKAGRITVWLEALLENSERAFRSELAKEPMTVLQEAYKEEIGETGNG